MVLKYYIEKLESLKINLKLEMIEIKRETSSFDFKIRLGAGSENHQ